MGAQSEHRRIRTATDAFRTAVGGTAVGGTGTAQAVGRDDPVAHRPERDDARGLTTRFDDEPESGGPDDPLAVILR
ncbi:hypothetical protein ABZ646_27495, partial [Streptomyces sp. NPDC007162]|uniref:hypothetical protein n=1 Tax=Streptomyces sp. NPDC007162 TaxID=3156917 RepID=UPI0033D6CAF0